MCFRTIGTLGVWIIGTTPLFAQMPSPPMVPPFEQVPPLSPAVFQTPALTPSINQAPPAPPSPSVISVPSPSPDAQAGAIPTGPTVLVSPDYISPVRPVRLFTADPEPYHIWFRAEAFAWWVKDAPLPVPLAMIIDGSGNSQTAIGSSNVGFGAFSGGRFVIGAWFDRNNIFGFETSFFALERRASRQSIADDGNGNPALGLSFYSTTPGQTGEYIQYLSSPGTFTGNILVSSKLETWGAEVNGALCVMRTANLEFTALAGFRYVDLEENLNVTGLTSDLSSGNFLVLNDQFSTRNQFYGGQLGAGFIWNLNRLSLDATGKIALGATHQVVDIQASSYSSATGNTTPGGFYAQPSNIGRYTANQFGFIPSVELKLSYRFFHSWRAFIGYDFMYWNQVVRPGNQIDRNINLTQSPVLGSGTLNGPASPGPLFSRSDFWAQGMNFGLEFRF